MNEYAIIVAGGKGTRIKSDVPKQFLLLNGRPVLMHTIDAFYRYSPHIQIILVLPSGDFDTWQRLCTSHGFDRPLILQAGGSTRFQSVKNGLSRITGNGLVAIHDGVRPLVTADIIAASFKLAAAKGSAVATVALKDSIRMHDGNTTTAMDRSQYRLVQTPQTFDVALIQRAYQQPEDPTLTDDASVAERYGHTIALHDGSYENIKITTADDLVVAEALLRARTAP